MNMATRHWSRGKLWLCGLGAIFLAALAVGTLRDAHFWRTPGQQGDALMRAHHYKEAEKAYANPWAMGVAQYRDGDFESAAKTFLRQPGAVGAYNAGNALLMHGKYAAAIASYDRALGFRPGWAEAEQNKALALARQQRLDASSKDEDKESADAYTPDKIVFDQKGENKNSKPVEIAESDTSDEGLQAIWLRRVQTTPGDFLRAKFAYQAAHPEPPKSKEGGK